MAANVRHVTKSPDGGWDVVKRDGARRSAHGETQAEAIERARKIVSNLGGGPETAIHEFTRRLTT